MPGAESAIVLAPSVATVVLPLLVDVAPLRELLLRALGAVAGAGVRAAVATSACAGARLMLAPL